MSIINPYRPKLTAQKYDPATSTASGPVVDLSCDIIDVTPDVDVPTSVVKTWCQSTTLVGEPEESFDVTVAARDETRAVWEPLVGETVELKMWDRVTDVDHRRFVSQIVLDPSLYGTTVAGEARTVSFSLPVLEALAWNAGTYAPAPNPPTGVTAGTPGSFSPAAADDPADLAALQALGDLGQTTAWTTGQSVVLGDLSEAYWDGSAWAAGQAT